MIQKRLLAQISGALLFGSLAASAATIQVTEDVTANTTWHATNTYLLQTVVYVKNNATLTIEPGTVIKGGTNAATLIAREGIPNLVSCLWVTRGSKLIADGAKDKPIIFTIEGDDVNNPDDLPYNLAGQWGGVVLCGKATINSANSTPGNAATPKYEQFEGTNPDLALPEQQFGGSDDTDNSGVLRYVSIRYPGTVFAPNRELNGLTMGAVGSGTTIEYVEVMNSSDDAFEWWGGTVNTKHLVAAFCEDDDFDTDQGYRGTNQFWFGIKPPWGGSSDSRAFETDGDLYQTVAGEQPLSQWTVHNATLIGRGKAETGFGGGAAWNARDEAAPNVINSVFAEFALGVLIDNDGVAEFTAGRGDLRNSIFDTGAGPSAANTNAVFLFADAARMNSVGPAGLGGISHTNNAGLNPRPSNGSPALGNVAPQGAGLVATSYRGAFAQDANWADGWTGLSQLGYLTPGPVPSGSTIQVTQDITENTTWHADKTYLLQTVVYVKNNATLTIEPGTVIKGGTNAATLIAREGIPNLVSCLWVTRGSKLIADGAKDKPIIFTIEGDDVSNPNDLPYNLAGQWGGVVLCGKATINSANSTPGNAATPKYEQFEGTNPELALPEQQFGGSDDTDNSGVLRYVSIRYPGTVFAPGKELNGLTMGAVGSGTTIEYVEVMNSSDDAFEWWGGTVNTKHLVAAFCEDDDFDTDQGYRGTNQFWFGIKPPWGGSSDSRAFETDGDLYQTVAGEQPLSQWTVHNATLIGRGKAETGFGGGAAWNARDEAAPNVINSVFAEFALGVLIDNDGVAEFTAGRGDLRNSIFDTGAGPSGANTNAVFLFADAARMNSVGPAGLGGISHTNNAGLNPRPSNGSPALGNVAPQGAGLVATSYRGAFAQDASWADGWTGLSQLGYLAVATVAPEVPMLSATRAGETLKVSFATQTGVSYQIQSTADLSGSPVWANEGAATAGTGSAVTVDAAITGAQKFFRVIAQ